MGKTSTRYRWTDADKDKMASLYLESEWSVQDIADSLGCTREAVRYHLKKRGTKFRGPGAQTERSRAKTSGERNYHWKGGRIRDHGYIRVGARGHPQADASGYVLEHRLVVERHLLAHEPNHSALKDGHLRSDWLVHHINGVKDDNRIDNLVPMTKLAHTLEHNPLSIWRDEIQRMRDALERHGIEW